MKQIARLKPGDLIGEMSLIDHSPHNASVRAGENVQALLLPFRLFVSKQLEPYIQIVSSVNRNLTKKLRFVNEVTMKSIEVELNSSRVKEEIGKLIFIVFVILSFWDFVVSGLHQLIAVSQSTRAISWTAIIGLLAISLYYYKASICSSEFYGMTMRKWKRNALEGIWFSLPLLFLAVLIKWLLIKNFSTYRGETIIAYNSLFNVLLTVIYVLLTPLQEFIARGVLQSAIRLVLEKYKIVGSIFLSSLLFSVFHSQISFLFACVAFVLGWFWGWLRIRQESLVGPIVSHALIGGWCLGVLDLGRFLLQY